ncbi:MAG: AarF/UbiB family protein [Pseudomonadota bacterium]
MRLPALNILRAFRRHRLDDLIPDSAPRRIRWPAKLLAFGHPRPEGPRGARLRAACLDLGPVYIKLGQLLSTRPDLLPMDIIDELSLLQDQVPPLEDFTASTFVGAALNDARLTAFAHIESEPLASASIAQVHRARLADGAEVVVKLVRPGIRAVILRDTTDLKRLAEFVHQRVSAARRLQLPRIMADHEAVLLDELDMFHEARNQIQLRRNFAESDLLYVPRVYAELTRQSLLVMEFVEGTPVNRLDELHAKGVDLKVLADKGVETFFTQVFVHNFFHADMHPGNILVDTRDPANPRYIALDCAIIGSLTEEDQSYLAQNVVAFFDHNYAGVVDLHLQSGWIPADTDAQAFEAVIREVCDPIFNKPLNEIYFGEFVVDLFRTAADYNVQVQPQLVLLQKTLLYIEGVGRQLYPQLDLWETAAPFMRGWADERFGPSAVLREWVDAGPELWRNLAQAPMLLARAPAQFKQIEYQLRAQQAGLQRMEADLSRDRRHTRWRRLAATGIIGIGLYLMWPALDGALQSGDTTVIAGLIGTFVGSALWMRA